MKNKIVLALLSLLYFQSFSQSREEPITPIGYESPTNLVIKLGLGIPSGDFGNTDIENEKSGMAKAGLMFEAEISHLLTKSFYLSFMGRFQFNGLDKDEFVDFYRSLVPTNVNVTFDSDPWVNRSFMAGFGTLTPVDPHTKFITRFMLGTTISTTPSFNAKLSDGTTTVLEQQSSETASALSFLIGAGFKLDLDSKTVLLFSGDYISTTPKFEDVNFRASVNNTPVANESFSFKQEIQLITLSVGLVVKL